MATAGVKLHMNTDGIARLRERAVDERLLRKPLRKLMREAGKVVKAEYVRQARSVSRRVARRVRIKVTQGPAPTYIPASVYVISRYGGAPAIVSGRRPGAKMPPIARITGGYPAAQAVKRTGIPARPFVESVFQTVRGRVESLLRDGVREIEQTWQA